MEPQPSSEVFSDELICEQVLASMGIDRYEPRLLNALGQYMRRLTEEVLNDTRKYSMHARKMEINVEDVHTATKLRDPRGFGLDSRIGILEIQKELNSKPLPLQIPELDDHRLPAAGRTFLARNYTFVPGSEAFPETISSSSSAAANSNSNSKGSSSSSSGFKGAKKSEEQIKIKITSRLGIRDMGNVTASV